MASARHSAPLLYNLWLCCKEEGSQLALGKQRQVDLGSKVGWKSVKGICLRSSGRWPPEFLRTSMGELLLVMWVAGLVEGFLVDGRLCQDCVISERPDKDLSVSELGGVSF